DRAAGAEAEAHLDLSLLADLDLAQEVVLDRAVVALEAFLPYAVIDLHLGPSCGRDALPRRGETGELPLVGVVAAVAEAGDGLRTGVPERPAGEMHLQLRTSAAALPSPGGGCVALAAAGFFGAGFAAGDTHRHGGRGAGRHHGVVHRDFSVEHLCRV